MSDSESSDQGQSRWQEVLTSPGQVPCVRRSFLTGITSGLGIGAGYFFMTSNVKRSTNVGFGSYVLVTMGTWFYCRYTLAQERVKQRLLKKALQDRIASEGIDEQDV
ncbi:cytochrome c oxidase assembly protein COX20, mitochondrial-like [Babylonia areolata]|uniref:cytochrome c oxidase assembly protein COX20, mitochondrial-like n=1 Tax=Babylonia areolata TaxID=304850 RepID=UPI003FD37960